MKRRLLTATLLLTLISCHRRSSSLTSPPFNQAALTGNVSNAMTGAPVEKAEIAVTQSGQTIVTLTSSNGNFSVFAGLLPGQIRVAASAKGYDSFSATTTLSTGSNRYDITLRPTS